MLNDEVKTANLCGDWKTSTGKKVTVVESVQVIVWLGRAEDGGLHFFNTSGTALFNNPIGDLIERRRDATEHW